ncbi:hypothetical protein C0995_005924 [Termitomyces sp. Mi166|nr:hypothetical protein C0995_005924 [Termitomyces sp. Mi166\
MSSSISSFFSSLFPVIQCEPEEPEKEPKAEAEAEAEEEEEPEDLHPQIREEAQRSAKCAKLTKHFEHCQEKVSSGQGFKGEDCVEELMMHCVDEATAPKLFSKLR